MERESVMPASARAEVRVGLDAPILGDLCAAGASCPFSPRWWRRSAMDTSVRFTFTANGSWNTGSTPFVWTKIAYEILAKALRKDRAINESRQ
jgi:hypothetical protein